MTERTIARHEPGTLAGQAAFDSLAVFGVILPAGLTATVHEAPVAGCDDPEFYDSTIAVIEGPAGRIEIYREGDACLHLTDGSAVRTPQEFRDQFASGDIPRDGDEGFDQTGLYWHDNAWFIVRPAGLNSEELDPDDVEYSLTAALQLGISLTSDKTEWNPRWRA